MGLAGVASVLSTFVLLIILTYRFCTGNKRAHITRNQNVLLIYNLLLADLQQALSFVISFYWYSKNEIVAPHPACFAQGWLIHIGDVSSGFWILAIASHTFYTVVKGQKFPHDTFLVLVGAIWGIAVILTVVTPAKFGYDAFVDAGAWCWIPEDRPSYRLGLHYIWIFLAEFGTVFIYILTFVGLQRRLKTLDPLLHSPAKSSDGKPSSPQMNSVRASQLNKMRKLNRAARYMIVYPILYVCLTLPLAGGRMAQMASGSDRQVLPDWYLLMAGTLLSSCGWLDVIVYTFTRHVLAATSRNDVGAASPMRFGADGAKGGNLAFGQDWAGISGTNVEIICGNQHEQPREHSKYQGIRGKHLMSLRRWYRQENFAPIPPERAATPSSTDQIMEDIYMRGVKAETTFEIRREPAESEIRSSSGLSSMSALAAVER